jgi:glycosyltransferase involved in cell wall biosynthesis
LRCGADLYHAHAVGRVGAAVRNAARLRGVPYVVSLHGGHTEMPASQLDEMARVRGMRLDLGKLVYPLLPQRRVLPDAAHVLCVGRSEAEAVAALYPRLDVTYLPNGVDTARFEAGDGARFRRSTRLAEGPLVVCIGRIDSQKNQLLLVEAMAAIRERHPDATAVCIGAVSQAAYLDQVRAAIARLGLEGNMRILPGLPPDDPLLADAYAAANVVVLPSVHEPFGVVVLEAWSAAKPVVVSRVGGLAGLVEEGRTGLLFPSGDARSLARAVEAVLDHPGLARRLGEAGRGVARARYSWDAHAERTLAVYERVLGRWRA